MAAICASFPMTWTEIQGLRKWEIDALAELLAEQEAETPVPPGMRRVT